MEVDTVEHLEADTLTTHLSQLDGWIPETALWVVMPDTGLAGQWAVRENSIASDPVGVALPADAALSVDLNTTEVSLSDPRTDAASMMWLVSFGYRAEQLDTPSAEGRLMTQRSISSHNAEDPTTPLASLSQETIFDNFEYPLLAALGVDQETAAALSHFQSSLRDGDFAQSVEAAGFSAALPNVSKRDSEIIERALANWDELR
ncbi:hypothetical protein [Natronoglycomyces albus]|uniref:Uncharacterized protein n=1 Tax=Natronoglycomyces albus TaxID=2811108 RepID=A0A895XUY1_9ACTN|nr:hypothetical protein [Natronoglycomyces albus]QSB05458.1 hypothetical protein JQS30_00490 [Natronoglycomyces albus]